MSLILLAFIAGVLTVLAPCVLPLLPVIIGSSVGTKDKAKPYLVTAGLVISISLFTLLLKASTLLLNVDPVVWKIVSGGIVVIFGLIYLFPGLWDEISIKLNLSSKSDQILEGAGKKQGWLGSLLIGGALGPVFASCSPTYSLIIATVLPVSFWEGFIYIVVYAIGLATVMLAVALLGRKLITRLKGFANPNGWFKKVLGIIFLIVGISIITGFDKQVETTILNSGYFDITKVEQNLLEKNMPSDSTSSLSPSSNISKGSSNLKPAPEITGIKSWINSNGETIKDLKGKVVLVDFWTYSCINCQRTLPFVTKWYDTYKDQGFVVLGIHAPEFAFEKKQENVEKAVKDFGINYPVGLDNDFSTWNNYKNQFWPAEYLIDKDGNIRRTHFGEGKYDETEQAIRELLKEKGSNISNELVTASTKEVKPQGEYCDQSGCVRQTPETYIGYTRADRFSNTGEYKPDTSVNYTSLANTDLASNSWSFGGNWKIGSESAVTTGVDHTLKLKYNAKEVYLVLGSTDGKTKIGKISGDSSMFGDSVKPNGTIEINQSTLYKLVKNKNFTKDGIMELSLPAGVEVNAFTFG